MRPKAHEDPPPLSEPLKFSLHRRSPWPGPPSIPILGSSPWLWNGAFTELVKKEWKSKYGEVFPVDFGMTRMDVICGENAATELLTRDSIHLGERPFVFFYQQEFRLEDKGVHFPLLESFVRASDLVLIPSHLFLSPITMCSSDNPLVDTCRKLNMKVTRDVGLTGARHASRETVDYISGSLSESRSTTIDLFQLGINWDTLTMLSLSHGLTPTYEELQTIPQVANLLHSVHEVLLMASFNRILLAAIPLLYYSVFLEI